MGWRRITTLPSNWAVSASSKSWSEAAAIGGTESAQRVIKSNESLFIFRPFEQECTLAAAGDQSRKHRFFVFFAGPLFQTPYKRTSSRQNLHGSVPGGKRKHGGCERCVLICVCVSGAGAECIPAKIEVK